VQYGPPSVTRVRWGEDQFQNLPLAAGKPAESRAQRQPLRRRDALLGRLRFAAVSEEHPHQRPPASLFGCGAADHAEEKRLEGRAPGKSRPAVEDLQVARLKHVLRLLSPPAAAGQGPGEAGRVKPFELALDVGGRHRSALRDWVAWRADFI